MARAAGVVPDHSGDAGGGVGTPFFEPGRLRLVLVSFAVCTFLGVLFASHFRTYYRIEWPLALWWGLKDWYLWGMLAPVVVWIDRRIPVSREHLLRWLAVHSGAALALAWVHPTLAISLSALVEGLGDTGFVAAVEGLFLKRYAVSFVTYVAILGVTRALLHHRAQKSEDRPIRDLSASGRGEGDGPTAGPAERLLVRKGDREYFLEVERIDRIEAEGNYVRIHTGEETYLERRTLRSVESQLDPSRFLRIHRSHVVNVHRVDRIEPGFKGRYEVILGDGGRLPLSRTYRKRLEDRVGESL